jgi:hypothetical protein
MEKINTDSIPQPINNEVVLFYNGNTQDIINSILYADSMVGDSLKEFSTQFSKDIDGLKAIWLLVKNNIEHKNDPEGKQNILMPAALWSCKKGDSKSKTLFVNAVLKSMGIECKYKFASYDNTRNVTHVYTVAYLDYEEILIDTSLSIFNMEAVNNYNISYPLASKKKN